MDLKDKNVVFYTFFYRHGLQEEEKDKNRIAYYLSKICKLSKKYI
jgi:hypothetical protein